MEQKMDVVEQPQDAVNEKQVTVEDMQVLLERVSQLEKTNERILDESKQYKSKYQNLKNEVSEKERTQLEESGNWKELLEKEKNRARDLELQTADLKKKTIKSNLRSEVARYATNPLYLDDVINNLPSDLLEMDEDNLTIKNVAEAVEVVKSKKPDFFKTTAASGMVSGRPTADVPKEKTFEDKLKENPRGLLSEVLKTSGLV